MNQSRLRRLISVQAISRIACLVSICAPLSLTQVSASEVLYFTAGDGKSFYSYSTRLDLKRDFYSMNINGGTRPYSFALTKPLVQIDPSYPGAQVAFRVIPKATGTTILTIKDTKGNAITRELVVYDPGIQPLSLTALPDMGNPVAVGQGRSFGVSGGNGPYTVVSAQPGIARLEAKTNLYTIWGVSAGTSQITVTDAKGAKVQGVVHVGMNKPLLISTDATLLGGGKGELVISSGNPPYTVTTSSHLSAAPKSNDAQGRTIYSLTAVSPGQGTLTVKDSQALTSSKTITIKDWVTLAFPQFVSEPRTLDVGQTTKLVVTGGTAPYVVTASNPQAVTLQPQGPGQYSVTGLQAGVVGFTAKDKSGAARELSLTIRNLPTLTLAAPNALTIGIPGTLTLVGGASPFTVTVSGNQLQLTKIDDKKFTLTPLSPGNVIITIRDGKATTQQHSISITAPIPPLKLYISSDTLKLSATGAAAIRVLSIQGGVAPYTATVSGNQLSLTQVNATQFQMTPKARGKATITVKDSKGTTATQTITVQ